MNRSRWLTVVTGLAMGWTAVATSGCIGEEEDPKPGSFEQRLQGSWRQGETSDVFVTWNVDAGCNWSCSTKNATVTLLDAECSGCTVLPRTESKTVQAGEELRVQVVPTTDAVIELKVTLRFDATKDVDAVKVLKAVAPAVTAR